MVTINGHAVQTGGRVNPLPGGIHGRAHEQGIATLHFDFMNMSVGSYHAFHFDVARDARRPGKRGVLRFSFGVTGRGVHCHPERTAGSRGPARALFLQAAQLRVKTAFGSVALDPERPPATWQEHAEFAAKLTRTKAGKVDRWGTQIPSSGFPYWLFQALATEAGGTLANAAGVVTDFAGSPCVKALRYWLLLNTEYHAHPPGIVDWGTTPGISWSRRWR